MAQISVLTSRVDQMLVSLKSFSVSVLSWLMRMVLSCKAVMGLDGMWFCLMLRFITTNK